MAEPIHCGRDDRDAVPLTDAELAGVLRALDVYRSTELIPRILARLAQVEAERDRHYAMRQVTARLLFAERRLADRLVEALRNPYALADETLRQRNVDVVLAAYVAARAKDVTLAAGPPVESPEGTTP